ncbi:MAG TPA: M14 family zinc carboxypeptidase, partial [Capillimicrobium sp.]|nr:M14 family zinc carboxypeptidase [Capillimicrobium sp.]
MSRAGAWLALTAIAALAAAAPAAAADRCARRDVPAPPPAPASVDAVSAYLHRVDRASDRVRTGTLGRSAQGRPLPYALVAGPRAVAPPAVAALSGRLRAVREGRARRLAPHTRAVVWLAAGVHANERSGVDADLEILSELAAGRHCAALRRLLVVVVPMQNPDGLVAGTRTNANGFDLNRDWFASTQPETRAKLGLLTRLPPVAFADLHEQNGSGFFFPPYADPIHHEIARPALRTIDRAVAPALRAAFDRAGLQHSSYAPYDLFFPGYGDSATTLLLGAAGMTFEKGSDSPYRARVAQHAIAARALLGAVARRRDALVRRWAGTWRQALREGARGRLQPNAVTETGHRVRFQVPRRPVHAYLLRADAHGADAAALVERLRSAGVRVGRLRADTTLRRFRPYGSSGPQPARLPAGTWVVPMAQTQKHWIEALLGQDAYVPFPYFYDVSSWSNPLLMGLEGGWSERPVPPDAIDLRDPATTPPAPAADAPAYAFAGDSAAGLALALELLDAGAQPAREPGSGRVHVAGVPRSALAARAAAHRVALEPEAAVPPVAVALRRPRVALLADVEPVVTGPPGVENSAAHESHAWTRFVLEQRLGVDTTVLTPAEIAAGALADGGFTALVVADGRVPPGALPGEALEPIERFVAGGGTFVGVRSLGLDVARLAGITTVRERTVPGTFRVPGATFAVEVDVRDPLAWGVGERSFQLNAGDPVLDPGDGTPVVRYRSGGG